MITLPHHCEFLSDAWLEEARHFLQREAAMRKEKFAGRTFSVSERFTDAPPHLKFPDDVAAWSMRYDGNGITVSRSFDERADVIVEGDYQAALSAAQFVGVLAPGAMKAMLREVRDDVRQGRDAMQGRAGGRAGARDAFAAARPHGPPHRRKSRPRAPRRASGPERQDPRDGRRTATR